MNSEDPRIVSCVEQSARDPIVGSEASPSEFASEGTAKEPEPKRFPRFGLIHVFYLMSLVAASVALLDLWGFLWAGIVILFWIALDGDIRRSREEKRKDQKKPQIQNTASGFTVLELIIVVAIIAIMIGMALPAVSRMRPRTPARRNLNAMRQVAYALFDYQATNGHLPPAYLADEDGNPMHSWRVLILPHLEGLEVFESYDFDLPWDHKENSDLAHGFLNFETNFHKDQPLPPAMTTIKLVTGPKTAFVGDKSMILSEISDEKAIFLIDDTANPIPWMSPQDVSVEQAINVFDASKNPDTKRFYKDSKLNLIKKYNSSVAQINGSVNPVGTLEDPNEIAEYFYVDSVPTRGIERLQFENNMGDQIRKPSGYILLALNIVLAGLPVFWIGRSKQESAD